MVGFLYHSINGASISVFTSSNSNQRNFVIARIAMDAANRLSAIASEMGQLQNGIQEHRRVLNFLLRSVRTIDTAQIISCLFCRLAFLFVINLIVIALINISFLFSF